MRFAHEVLMNQHSFLDSSCVCTCLCVCVYVFGSSDHFLMINQS